VTLVIVDTMVSHISGYHGWTKMAKTGFATYHIMGGRMDNKKDFRVAGKCTAETYADHCRCTRGAVFGLHECVFYDDGECLNGKKEEKEN